jgi:RNA polymerase sigma-70 factor (ECF subfamily)
MAAKVRYSCDDNNLTAGTMEDPRPASESTAHMTALYRSTIGRSLTGEPVADSPQSRPVVVKSERPDHDALLLRRIADGDRRAAQLLLDQYLGRIVTYGYRMMGDNAEAEDVAQETFLRLWRNIETWRADAPLIHWLHRVAYNLCIDRLRRRKPVSLEALPEPLDSEENPAGTLHRLELADAVAAAIAQLPERQRAAVVFVHQEGFSNIETAVLMEISVEAVESLLARARRSLRKLLEALRPELQGDI